MFERVKSVGSLSRLVSKYVNIKEYIYTGKEGRDLMTYHKYAALHKRSKA